MWWWIFLGVVGGIGAVFLVVIRILWPESDSSGRYWYDGYLFGIGLVLSVIVLTLVVRTYAQ